MNFANKYFLYNNIYFYYYYIYYYIQISKNVKLNKND